MKIHYKKHLKVFAKELRNNSTKSEIKLWKYLKGKQMMGYDFHRQRSIDEYIADFFCHNLKLVIELDGFTHRFEEVTQRDVKKENKLSEFGITVLRFSDDQVIYDIYNVLKVIENYIIGLKETNTIE
jgi:very-short-patch-repair endonuclease